MQIEHQMTESHVRRAQPLDDRIQRRALLRDKKHATALGHALRNDVGDRLALAGSWRPLHDTVLTFADKHDGAVLRGVSIEHKVIVGRRTLIELGGLDVDQGLSELLP